MARMRRNSRASGFLWALLFVASFATLVLLRAESVGNKSFEALYGSGILHGLLLDAVVASLLTGIYLLGSALSPLLGLLLYLPLQLLVFVTTLGDLLYFRFFGSPLKLWVIRNHISDIGVVGGSAVSLGFHPLIVVAFVSLVIAVVVAFRLRSRLGRKKSWRRALAFLPLLVVTFYAHQWQFSTTVQNRFPRIYPTREFRMPGNLATHSAVFTMLDELDPKKRDRFVMDLKGGLPEALNALEAFRQLGRSTKSQAQPVTPEQTRVWRRELGLNPDRAPNVIVVFVESLRGYEFLHPELGPKVYPNARSILDKHGWLFTRTYSSALTAGQTVRGVYESLCSALPNLLGPAPHLAYPEQDIECVQKTLLESGYQTAWMVPHERNFHNKATFEKHQGTQVMLDWGDFDPKREKPHFELGMADHEFFRLFVEALDKKVDPSKPFFVHTINVGTHHPWGDLPSGAPEALKPANESSYEKFMSRLRYWDYSFGILFEALSKKPWMKDTVLVLVADHSMYDAFPPGLSSLQQQELAYRIPMALLTLGLKPRVLREPVHHLDIGPTIAALAGVPSPRHFLGHNLLAETEGSPWVYADGRQEVSYRTKGRSCYYFSNRLARACYRNDASEDPLYSSTETELKEDPAERAFFERVVRSDHMMHGFNAWTSAFK
jgi:phosphoglycerol transferase MdoB-like AlkP superfamily enzyme